MGFGIPGDFLENLLERFSTNTEIPLDEISVFAKKSPSTYERVCYYFRRMLFSGATIKGSSCVECTNTFDVALVGDLVLSSGTMRSKIGVNRNVALRSFGTYLSRIQKADALFANFEGSIYERARPRNKRLSADFTLGFTYAQASFLTDVHPNLALSVSNNHVADYGHEGIRETVAFLRDNHIPYSGVGDVLSSVCFVHVGGVTIALAAFTDMLHERYFSGDGTLSVARATEENIQNSIAYARGKADLVFVSLHVVGNLYAPSRFLPDAHQRQLAQVAVRAGADVVFGHHPHRLQAFERVSKTFVFHGLGAFLYDPAISSIVHKSSWLYDAVQIDGGGLVFLRCCKHVVRSAEILPTRTITQPNGGYLVTRSSIMQIARAKMQARRSRSSRA